MALPVKKKFQMQAGVDQPNFNLVTMFLALHGGVPTGNVYYVHNSGTATGTGASPREAVSTIDAAINLTTASQGDVIAVLPGHAEDISGAAGIAQDVIGVRIVGLGVGRQRPAVTFITADAASWDVSAAKCSIENMVLINGRDAQTAMVNVTAADCVIDGCEFMTGDATTQTLVGILTNSSADRLRISNCHMHGLVNAGTTSQISLVGGDSIVIRDNIICGACGTTGNIAQATTACTNLMILNNYLLNQTADANNKVIELGSTTTGIIGNNRFAVIDSTSPAPVTAAGMYVSGNYTTGAAGVTASTLM